MGWEYYAILDIPRSATIFDIKLAYRKLALRLHPKRKQYPQHPNPRPEGTFDLPLPYLPELTYWDLLNEAYDALSDPLRREIYDKYGDEGLKRGVPAPDGYVQRYIYHGEAMQTYFEFFGSYSPYSDLIDAATNPPPLYCTNEGVGVIHKDPIVERLLYVDLEEIFHGGMKLVKISRSEFVDEFKMKTEVKEVELSVFVPPGVIESTRLQFLEAGDRGPTRIPADIVFIVCDKPHKIYRREGYNLIMDYNVTLRDALTGFKMTIETIDERKLEILITDVVDTSYIKCISNEGLPNPNNNRQKGDLFVHFKIMFPTYIPKQLRMNLAKIFDEIADTENDNNNEGRNICSKF